MNELYFETQGNNTYLVYKIKDDDIIDSMSLGMLSNNKIAGLAQTIFMQMDSERYIKFNVSSRVSGKQFFTGAVNRKRVIGVFKGIINAMIAVEEYMLEQNSIILDMDYIFADVTSCETNLICLPVNSGQREPVEIREFFKKIMFNTQFDQTEDCGYVTKIINYLNSAVVFSVNEFKNILEDLESETSHRGSVYATSMQSTGMNTGTATPVPTTTGNSNQTVIQPRPMAVSPQPKQAAPAPPPQLRPVLVPTAVSTPAPVPPMPKPGMPVPPPPTGKEVPPAPQKPAAEEKEITFMYLMQHYNKENAALYKAQKEQKKQQKAEVKGAPKQTPPPVKPQQAKPQAMLNFAIPGQPAPAPGGQTVPPPMPPQPAPRPVQAAPQQPPVVKPQQVTPQPQPVQQPEPAYVPRPQTQSAGMNFGETTVLGGAGIGETTVLGVANNAQQAPQPYLMRVKNNERIPLNKPVFRVGKERSYVDYFVGDNTAVSRSHANIITKEEQYFVVDTNSTNHTFVNGVMISSNQAVEIFNGDKIRLANEEFEFHLY